MSCTVNKTNGEFDIALKLKDGYAIYEAKYYTGVLTENEMLQEEVQIKKIKGLAINKIGFITVSGIEKKIIDFDCIDGED